jgi:predicted lipid-binding transport protein (Tim44 family)
VNGSLIEVVILAAVAMLVLARLYSVLGKRTGSEGPARPRTAGAGEAPPVSTPPAQKAPAPVSGPAGEGIEAIIAADPAFDPGQFLNGAKAAYEMIVQAFSAGDKAQLRELLTDRVFASYAAAIDQRQSSDKGPELVRLRVAEIIDARLEGVLAKIAIRFEAELAEGAHGLRDTREKWTFEREVRARDPNWRLSGVAQA